MELEQEITPGAADGDSTSPEAGGEQSQPRDFDAEARRHGWTAKEEFKVDPVQARKELNEWIGDNDWYVLDDTKRKYADLQADLMGPAIEWDGGQKAWLDELGKRVDRKFAEKKPSPVNGGGNRPGSASGG